MHFVRACCVRGPTPRGRPPFLGLSGLRALGLVWRAASRCSGPKRPPYDSGPFWPLGPPPPCGRGRRSSPGPLLLSQPSRGPGWPPACAAAHSGLRGASAAALAFLKPRAPASRASPFFPFGALPARGVSACARGVKAGPGVPAGTGPTINGSSPLLPCWEPHYSTASRVCARRSRPATHPAGGHIRKPPAYSPAAALRRAVPFILRGPGP